MSIIIGIDHGYYYPYCGSSKDTTNPLRITSMMSCRVTFEILSIIILSFISR